MFDIDHNMRYDTSILDKIGKTPYSKIKNIISKEEYEELPCYYLEAVLFYNKASIKDFIQIINLYRCIRRSKNAIATD